MPMRLSRPSLAASLALALIATVLGLLWPRAAITPFSSYDQRFYLGIAYDLRHEQRFTDGFAYGGGNAASARPSGMRFAPLYPAMLAGLAAFDPQLRTGIDCTEATLGSTRSACPRGAPSARGVQFLMLVGFYWLLWAAITRAAGSPRVGWIGLGLALLAAPSLLLYVNTLMTETVSLLLSGGACALAMRAGTSGQAGAGARRWWLACGLVLGAAILSRPAFLYLFWAGLAVGALKVGALWVARAPQRRSMTELAAFSLGVVIVIGPWLLRNAWVLHRAALSFGYASHTLVQRIAFDAMTPREYGLSFICWLPDGSGLGRAIAGPHACDRFGWDEHPDSFYSIGNGALMQQSLAAAGGWDHHMHYLLHHYLLAEPVRHLLVTLPLILRGLCVSHYWGLLLAPVSLWAMWRAARIGQVAILLLSVPGWFLLVFNALVAVNQPRYNFLLVLPFSLAGAMLIDTVIRGRRTVDALLPTRLEG